MVSLLTADLRYSATFQGHDEYIQYRRDTKRVSRSQEWLSVELEPMESRGKR
jgi:hypothetical protein